MVSHKSSNLLNLQGYLVYSEKADGIVYWHLRSDHTCTSLPLAVGALLNIFLAK